MNNNDYPMVKGGNARRRGCIYSEITNVGKGKRRLRWVAELQYQGKLMRMRSTNPDNVREWLDCMLEQYGRDEWVGNVDGLAKWAEKRAYRIRQEAEAKRVIDEKLASFRKFMRSVYGHRVHLHRTYGYQYGTPPFEMVASAKTDRRVDIDRNRWNAMDEVDSNMKYGLRFY